MAKRKDSRRKERGIFKQCDCRTWEKCGHNWIIAYQSPAGFQRENTGQANKETAKRELAARKESISCGKFKIEDVTGRKETTLTGAMQEYVEWRSKKGKDAHFMAHGKTVVEKFGALPLDQISRRDVREWIDDELCPRYSHNTVSHKVNCGRSLYSWLYKEDRIERNPFKQHEWVAKGGDGIFIKPTISPEEWQLINKFISSYPAAIQIATLAYYTGLRPSEVHRIEPGDFNHRDLELRVKVVKTGKSERYIAIPRALSAWAQSWKWQAANEITVQHVLAKIRGKNPALAGLCVASFRKNFAAAMEAAGAPLDSIDAHQGRNGGRVITKHYLKDPRRAVGLMRPYITQVFCDVEPKSIAQPLHIAAN